MIRTGVPTLCNGMFSENKSLFEGIVAHKRTYHLSIHILKNIRLGTVPESVIILREQFFVLFVCVCVWRGR